MSHHYECEILSLSLSQESRCEFVCWLLSKLIIADCFVTKTFRFLARLELTYAIIIVIVISGELVEIVSREVMARFAAIRCQGMMETHRWKVEARHGDCMETVKKCGRVFLRLAPQLIHRR